LTRNPQRLSVEHLRKYLVASCNTRFSLFFPVARQHEATSVPTTKCVKYSKQLQIYGWESEETPLSPSMCSPDQELFFYSPLYLDPPPSLECQLLPCNSIKMQKRKKALQAFANGARNEIINRDQEGQKGLQMDMFVSMTTVSGFFFLFFLPADSSR